MNNVLLKFGVYCIALALIGWICGGMENESLSYTVGLMMGLGLWYGFYWDLL